MGKEKRAWTSEEVEALLAGVEKHGLSNWKLILSDPQFASSFTNRTNIDLKDKWRNLRDQLNRKRKVKAARRNYLKRSSQLSSIKRSKKEVAKDVNDFEDNHDPERSGAHDDMINHISEKIVYEDLNDSEDNHNPSTITRKISGTHDNMINHTNEKIAVEEVNDSQDDNINPSLERSGTHNQFSENVVVEELSDSKDDHDPCTISPKKSGTHKNRKGKKKVVKECTYSQDYYNPTTISRQRRGTRRNNINEARKLNSMKVHSYLENLWLSFPQDKKSSFAHIDPLWFNLYSEDSNKEKVLNWIRKKDIFSRKYVFLPIVMWGHWKVLVFCHFGQSLESKVKTPCILLLDSLAKAGHSREIEPIIRKFVLDIYKNFERAEDVKLLQKMPFLVPKVPQQRDGEECGYFVLYYIKLFVENAPESFSITDGYPYFMKKDWFNFQGFDSFCRTLDASHEQ